MQVGFITQLLWPRYGAFWEALIAETGATPQRPPLLDPEEALGDPRVRAVPGLAFRLAAAQALALHDVDVLVVPDLNPGEETPRGSGQDLWIASFPDALQATLHSVPPVLAVPASLHSNLESLAVNTLHALTNDLTTVRRSWERHRAKAKPPRSNEPRWQKRSGERKTVGIVGQPWLVTDEVLALLRDEHTHVVGQHQLDPVMLRREGERADPKLIATDREVVGAARYLSRKGDIDEVWILVDRGSGADAALAARIERLSRTAPTVKVLQDVAADGVWARALS